MSFVKIWVHVVWSTKNREPILNKEIRQSLFNHIKSYGKEKEIYIDFINGYVEHIHCLIALNADSTISKTIQLLKGESSHWANENGLLRNKLEWAKEYFAVSVSESMIDKVRDYIKNQEEHHKKISFSKEVESFIEKYKFQNQG
jgi:REP element-mobilizing transposase RayT